MNGRMARKIRKEAKRAALARDKVIIPELKAFINSQKLGARLYIALRIIMRRF